MEKDKKEWFSDWFDTKYYHILYKNRDSGEADFFLNNLIQKLNPAPESHFLDLACGKGRHSIYINKTGYKVTGLDISPNSIKEASGFENPELNFYVHDMRQAFGANIYDCILNLFTSFGYFENERDNVKVLKNIYHALKPGGIFVMDFMNVLKVAGLLVPEEEKIIEGIRFKIKRKIEKGFIVKSIKVIDGKAEHTYFEKVEYLAPEKIRTMLQNNGFNIIEELGDYHLNPFNKDQSDRIIFIARK